VGRAGDPARRLRDRRNRPPARCALPAPDLPIDADGGLPGRPYRRTMLTPKVICLCQTTAHPVGQRPLAAIAGGARTAGFR
jgi:hypothetical protein